MSDDLDGEKLAALRVVVAALQDANADLQAEVVRLSGQVVGLRWRMVEMGLADPRHEAGSPAGRVFVVHPWGNA